MNKFHLLKFMNRALFHDKRLFESVFVPLVARHYHNTRGVRCYFPAVCLEIEKHATVFNCVKYINKLPDDSKIRLFQIIFNNEIP
jgi:hypothetical protein